MQKIIPHIWFTSEAGEAAKFYISVFNNSKIVSSSILHDTPSGDVETVSFEIAGYRFMAISAGPLFQLNASISFMLNFDPSKDDRAKEHLEEIWERLSDGGKVLMPLDTYPFSERYGWIKDKYGISWQLILTDPAGEDRPFIIPSLLFITDEGESAEAATEFYLSVFKNTKRGALARYPEGMEPNKAGAIMFTDFQLEGQWFAAMDGSSAMHRFAFNEALSLMVLCKDQEEIDYYWEQLSAVPEAEQCGWLKDNYGVSWQIVPERMGEMLASSDTEAVDRVTKAFLEMKKFDIKKLEEAYNG